MGQTKSSEPPPANLKGFSVDCSIDRLVLFQVYFLPVELSLSRLKGRRMLLNKMGSAVYGHPKADNSEQNT